MYMPHTVSRDGNGHIFVSQDGDIEIESVDEFKLGSILPKANMGWSNNFSYKGINLGVTLTARFGGIALSGTQSVLDQYGVSQKLPTIVTQEASLPTMDISIRKILRYRQRLCRLLYLQCYQYTSGRTEPELYTAERMVP